MSEVVIRASKLTKKYRSGDTDLVVFADMNMEVKRGERLALIGESGVGKSTLLYLLSGLDSPTSGTISYNFRELAGLADSELADFRNREIGFVWQSHNLLPEFTAQENVMMPLLVRGAPQAEALSASWKGLPKWAWRIAPLIGRASSPAASSRGSPWRAPWSASLRSSWPMNRPGIWTSRRERRSLIFWATCSDCTTSPPLLVTHNNSFAQRCDRILKLEGGVLVPG